MTSRRSRPAVPTGTDPEFRPLDQYPRTTLEQVRCGVFITYNPRSRCTEVHTCNIDQGLDDVIRFPGPKRISIRAAQHFGTTRAGIVEWKRNWARDYVDASREYLPLRGQIEHTIKRKQQQQE